MAPRMPTAALQTPRRWEGEMPENVYFIVAAYAATWIVILGYLLRLRALDARANEALDHAKSVRGGA